MFGQVRLGERHIAAAQPATSTKILYREEIGFSSSRQTETNATCDPIGTTPTMPVSLELDPVWTQLTRPHGVGSLQVFEEFGRAGEIRTRDLLHPKQKISITYRRPH